MGVLDRAAHHHAHGQTFALATVVRTVSVTAAKAGAKALITGQGVAEVASEVAPLVPGVKLLMVDGAVAPYESFEDARARFPVTPIAEIERGLRPRERKAARALIDRLAGRPKRVHGGRLHSDNAARKLGIYFAASDSGRHTFVFGVGPAHP